jgi:hypothetical protein
MQGTGIKQVWFVVGEDMEGRYVPTLLDTKETAERYARMLYPDEQFGKRYARVYYTEVFTMSDLNGG